jgi:hypothetical protein
MSPARQQQKYGDYTKANPLQRANEAQVLPGSYSGRSWKS